MTKYDIYGNPLILNDLQTRLLKKGMAESMAIAIDYFTY